MSNDSLMPWQIIKNLVYERKDWSNEQILEELRLLPILPDADYYEHAQEDEKYGQMIQVLYTYLAITDLAEKRHLIDAVPMLLERAPYGDFGETMRGLNGAFLRIIGKTEKKSLYQFAVEAAHSSNPGARLWATVVLFDPMNPSIIDVLIPMLDDGAVIVAAQVASLLSYYGNDYPHLRSRILSALKDAKSKYPELNTNSWSHIDDSIKHVEQTAQFLRDE